MENGKDRRAQPFPPPPGEPPRRKSQQDPQQCGQEDRRKDKAQRPGSPEQNQIQDWPPVVVTGAKVEMQNIPPVKPELVEDGSVQVIFLAQLLQVLRIVVVEIIVVLFPQDIEHRVSRHDPDQDKVKQQDQENCGQIANGSL